MTKAINAVRQFLADVNYAASLDNRFGHKMLAVCYGVILFQIGFAIWLGVVNG
jgi:hypothetical protein